VGKPATFDYRMSWHYFSDGSRPPAGWVAASRTAAGKSESTRKFVIDFTGSELLALPADQPLEAAVHVSSNATLIEQQLTKVPQNGQWRLVFQINPKNDADTARMEPIELRAFLKKGSDVLTETWSYVYLP
jgi:glucans biosynthesis protein